MRITALSDVYPRLNEWRFANFALYINHADWACPASSLTPLNCCLQVNNGVYKSGFCTSQSAYERAQRELYSALDILEGRLRKHRFLLGDL